MSDPIWRKSSRSQGMDNSSCVEVADLSGLIGVRDSKAPDAGHLVLSTKNFVAFLSRVKCDESPVQGGRRVPR